MTDPVPHARRRPLLAPLLVPLFAVIVAGLGIIGLATWTRTTVVVLVRHAESAVSNTGDPDLSPAGERRAAQLGPFMADALAGRNVDHLYDSGQLTNIIYNIRPDEIYHLGAQSHVRVSFDLPEYTGDVTALGTTRLLEAVRRSGIRTKFYQASSSEMFGAARPPQNEQTPFYPRSPYAAAKVYAYWVTVNYREGYNLFNCNGILFNHDTTQR